MKELLVPCKDMDTLKIAIKSKANAVYLGGTFFSARAYAKNFTNDEIVIAIKYAHLYGVKVYVAVNTIIYESELKKAYDYVFFLHKNGVDAVIMEDLGLISLVRRKLPNLVIHASTQMHNTDQNSINFLESLGIKRVVLARELSLEEIKNIKTNMEKEVFIHGALCISYSGECFFSKMSLNRSGNRGMCAQMCRLPYTLIKNNKEVLKGYILSTKELNTITNFNDILKSDIKSFKIEGRMKSKEYVGCVTKLYRKYIDEHILDNEILNDLKVIFNRDFTTGYLFNDKKILSINQPNHRGVKLGKVINIDKRYIGIKLNTSIHQGDGIRFSKANIGFNINYLYSQNKLLINEASTNDIIYIKNTFNTFIGDIVYKTSDITITKKYSEIDDIKIPITLTFKANINDGMRLTISDGENILSLSSNNVHLANNIIITKEDIKKQLTKLKDTSFICSKIDILLEDNLFIYIKDLNDLRRNIIEKLISIRENKKIDVIEIEEKVKKQNKIIPASISTLVRNEEQIKACIDMKVDRIYIADIHLYKKYKNSNVYFREYKDNHNSLEENILATKTGDLTKANISDYSLNITNHESIDLLSNMVDIVTISVEVNDKELEEIADYYNNKLNIEKIIYGRIDVMTIKHCMLKQLLNDNKVCNICSNDIYAIRDRNNNIYPIITIPSIHLTHILDCKVINDIDKIDFYRKIGINNFRLEFFNETYDECIKLIKMTQ